ncbi:hypothetical protein [Arvimicrobium flavum]|uniref:hypothetical protein n=1 Tax=Arvimicrobium flavum TaxID=3393320 RepID=UPI00237A4FD9|nr:hypothetical protein [Mesorhizobium shangrilense]
MTRTDLVDLAHDVASLAAVALFVMGVSAVADRLCAVNSRAAACEIAATEPTDWNLEQCSGEPISLQSAMEDK